MSRLLEQHDLRCRAGKNHNVGIDRRFTERRIDHRAGCLGELQDAGDFFHFDVADIRHKRKRLFEFFDALLQQENIVSVASDGTVVLVGGHGVERLSGGCNSPKTATGRVGPFKFRDTLGWILQKFHRDRTFLQAQ